MGLISSTLGAVAGAGTAVGALVVSIVEQIMTVYNRSRAYRVALPPAPQHSLPAIGYTPAYEREQRNVRRERVDTNAAPRNQSFRMPSLNADNVEIVSRDYIDFEKRIGEGSFSSVYKGKLKHPDGRSLQVAIKSLKNSGNVTVNVDVFFKEAKIMGEFDHKNVIGLIGSCLLDQPRVPLIFMPYMVNGDLKAYLLYSRPGTPQFLSVAIRVDILRQIAEGMNYIAGKQYVHRDLAARNCLLDVNLVPKISDFGLTKRLYGFAQSYHPSDPNAPNPYKWSAPECMSEFRFTTHSDVWSYGIVMWEVLSRGKDPYPGLQNWDIYPFLESGRRLAKPEECTNKLYEIMRKCWHREAERRPTFQRLVAEVH